MLNHDVEQLTSGAVSVTVTLILNCPQFSHSAIAGCCGPRLNPRSLKHHSDVVFGVFPASRGGNWAWRGHVIQANITPFSTAFPAP